MHKYTEKNWQAQRLSFILNSVLNSTLTVNLALALSLMAFIVASFSLANTSQAAEKKQGAYTIYYDVLPTSFLSPQVAQGYGLVRSQGQAFVRITVQKELADGTQEAVAARVSGTVSSLAGQLNSLGFKSHTVGKNDGYFSLASFRFNPKDQEPLRFNLRVTFSSQQPAAELNFIQRIEQE